MTIAHTKRTHIPHEYGPAKEMLQRITGMDSMKIDYYEQESSNAADMIHRVLKKSDELFTYSIDGGRNKTIVTTHIGGDTLGTQLRGGEE